MTFNRINFPSLPRHFEDLDVAVQFNSRNIGIFSVWKNVDISELAFGDLIWPCATSSDEAFFLIK